MNALRRTAVLLLIPFLAAACDEDDPSAPAGPVIGLDATNVVFEATMGEDPAPQDIEITSESGPVSGLSMSTVYLGNQEGWLGASLSGTSIPATLTLAPQTGELPPGVYSAMVILEADGAQNSPKGLNVIFTVEGASGPHVFTYTPPAGAPAVTSVSVRGSFNGWGETPMTFADGSWTLVAPLDAGTYEYKFYINGGWPGDMCNDETWGHPSEDFWIDLEAASCNGGNAVITVLSPGPMFTYEPPAGAPAITSISMRGEINGWGETPMIKIGNEWRVAVDVAPGTYQYKFYINGTWPGDMCNDATWGDPDNNFWIDPDADGCEGGNAKITF